jgi:outer membrane protein OmpA-like peptidoglycan-associated protein
MFPFIDEDGVLYFSSDGYSEGKGGLDMYAVKVSDPIHQEKPKNLGFPINSNKDDFSFVVRSGKSEGYFSSNRAGGKGDDDIYFFKRTELIKAACTQIANGVVREIGTNKLVPEAKVDLYDATGTLLESTFADANAKFSFKVACKSDYKTIGNKEGYDTATATFTSTDTAAIELNLGLNLKPLKEFINKRGLVIIDINMIYFDLDKSFIRQDAKKELEKVLKIMKKYPTLNIELGSHTDSRGSDIYNKALSERRAQATVAWLIDRGVNAANISAKGYGETQLVNNCVNGVICSELEHQLNRRTEFVVLNPEEIK